MTDLLTRSATDLRSLLKVGDISSHALTLATLARIDACNSRLNAVVARNDAATLKAADAADQRLRAGCARPLEGLPVTIKDTWDVAGLVSTAGASQLAGLIPDKDAIAVQRLRDAGAVIIGKTNVPEMGGDHQTYNALYGVTSNPWNIAYSPGGSSGGAAAAVAAGMSAFELGSDIGGSIRWPASACGLFGLKPTWDLVPMYGHTPPLRAQRIMASADLTAAGPIARSAADLDLILSVIAGPLNAAGPAFLRKPDKKRPSDLRIALWLDVFAPVDSSVAKAVNIAAAYLAQNGAEIDETPDFGVTFFDIFEVYALLLYAIMLAGLPGDVRDAIVAQGEGCARDDLSLKALQARAILLRADDYIALRARRAKMQFAFAAFFSRYDAILAPVAPTPALRHDHNPDYHARFIETDAGRLPYFDLVKWSAPATLLHLPAAVAPVTLTSEGMPVGVQIICAENGDRSAIAIADMIEQATGGFLAPDFYEKSLLL